MSLAGLVLLRPWWLLALLPVSLLLWRLWRVPGDGAAAWRRVVDAHLLPHLLVGRGGDSRGRLAALAVGLILAVLALAGPGLEDSSALTYRRDLTRVLVVDLSTPAQLERAKLKILALLRAQPEGQTALVVYAGEPYLVVPPTSDVDTIARFVPELAADVVPVPGAHPERAFSLAAKVLERSGSTQRDLVWITAGSGSAGLPPAGARLAILHAGAADDAALAAMARESGGIYVRMRADDSDVDAIAAALAPSGARIADGSQSGVTDFGCWLLLPLLPLAALGFRRGLLAVLLAPLCLAGLLAPTPARAFELPVPAWMADYQAWRRFQAGDAEADFSDRRWRAVALYRAGRYGEAAALLSDERDPDSLYNRGNALARHGRLSDALAAYEAALEQRPDDADIRHNRDLVLRLLKQEGGNSRPPPPAPRPSDGKPPPGGEAEREAARLAEQWLRRVPDEPGSLLRKKLAAEHRRRQAGEEKQPW